MSIIFDEQYFSLFMVHFGQKGFFEFYLLSVDSFINMDHYFITINTYKIILYIYIIFNGIQILSSDT